MAMRLAHCGPQIRTNAVRTALIDRVARLALGKNSFALGRIGGGEQRRERNFGSTAAFAAFDALDYIALLAFTGHFAVNDLAETMIEPRAAMPAAKAQPAMVLLRSAMMKRPEYSLWPARTRGAG
jgi:hypothetical protein